MDADPKQVQQRQWATSQTTILMKMTLLPYWKGNEPICVLCHSGRLTGLAADLIPANLQCTAQNTSASEASTVALQLLITALESVESRYDVIVLDPPPSLGMISLSVMNASTQS